MVYNDFEGGIFMNNNLKCILALATFIILTILGYFLLNDKSENIIESNSLEGDFIFVHIEGEIENPGLAKVKYGTRLYELIEEVGGATENADLSRINLSSIVCDEQKVIIPTKIISSESDNSPENQNTENGLININTANKEKLMTLSGVGESTAEKIIKYREHTGYFNTIEDIMNVQGIGESKFNNIKDDITT